MKRNKKSYNRRDRQMFTILGDDQKLQQKMTISYNTVEEEEQKLQQKMTNSYKRRGRTKVTIEGDQQLQYQVMTKS